VLLTSAAPHPRPPRFLSITGGALCRAIRTSGTVHVSAAPQSGPEMPIRGNGPATAVQAKIYSAAILNLNPAIREPPARSAGFPDHKNLATLAVQAAEKACGRRARTMAQFPSRARNTAPFWVMRHGVDVAVIPCLYLAQFLNRIAVVLKKSGRATAERENFRTILRARMGRAPAEQQGLLQ